MNYFDSSALVKRYVEESGSASVKSILSTVGEIATSKLTYPEILSALMRKHRAGELAKKPLQDIVARFERDWHYMLVLEFHNDLLQTVKFLLQKYPLKAADAIHLSSALWLRNSVKVEVTFVTPDSILIKAAGSENLRTLNPLDGTR